MATAHKTPETPTEVIDSLRASLVIDFVGELLGVDTGMIDPDRFTEHCDALARFCQEKGIKL